MEIKCLYEGRHLNFVSHDGWEYVSRRNVNGVVVITAVTEENKLLLVEQLRKPLNRAIIELPAGLSGDIAGEENEALVRAGKRELVEETGYEATSMKAVTAGPASAGLTDEFITFLQAEGLRKIGTGGGDASENIIVHEIPLAQLHEWIIQQQQLGKLIDYKIWVGLYFYHTSKDMTVDQH